MIILRTNEITEKQLAQIALSIQHRWNAPTFVKMHEIVIMDDDLDERSQKELLRDFETGIYEIFEYLEIISAFRLKRTGKSKYNIVGVPGAKLPQWMEDILAEPKVPEGVFACPHCVLPHTLILGDNKPISEYSVGNNVLGRTGLNEVIQTFVRPYKGELISIHANGMLPILTTPEHPVLVSSSSTRQHRVAGHLASEISFSEEKWLPAGKLMSKNTSTDENYVVVPIVAGSFKENRVGLSPFIKKHLPYHRAYRTDFPLNEKTAWLLGLFVAEGSITEKEVRFSLNRTEEEIRAEIVRIANELGYSTITNYSQVVSSMLVIVTSRVLARAFDQWCGHRAPNKAIPDFILCHSDKRILASFLQGFEAGDSYDGINKLRGNKVYRTSITTSRILAQQLQLAYARLGIWSGVSVRSTHAEGLVMGRRCSLHVKYGVSYPLEPNLKRQKVRFLGDRVLSPIRKITRTDYEGPVCNLHTTDNTYLVSNAIVHNCGRWFSSDMAMSLHQKIHYIA